MCIAYKHFFFGGGAPACQAVGPRSSSAAGHVAGMSQLVSSFEEGSNLPSRENVYVNLESFRNGYMLKSGRGRLFGTTFLPKS